MGNHVSQGDIFYLIQRFGVSFVGKAEAREMLPLKWAGDSCGAIWVDRSQASERNSVVQKIIDYVARHKTHPSHPLVIFPEGTTSNGSKILSLKRGAFMPLTPVKVVLLDYLSGNSFHNMLDYQGDLSTILFSMCFPYLNLTVTSFPPFDPSYLFTPDTSADDRVLLYSTAI